MWGFSYVWVLECYVSDWWIISLYNEHTFHCFFLHTQALALTPMILVKSRKFAALFTMGSVFSLGRCVNINRYKILLFIITLYCYSFSFLWGPWGHIKHLFSRDRLPFTAVYLLTIIATLYFALGVRLYIYVWFCTLIVVCLPGA